MRNCSRNRSREARGRNSCIISRHKNDHFRRIDFPVANWNNVLFRPIIERSRRRSCWSTAWWRLSGTPAPSLMTTPAASASTWRWSSPTEERWPERRSLSTCWRNPESSTRQRKYQFFLALLYLSNVSNPMIGITSMTFICSSDPYEFKSSVCTFSERLPRRSFFILLTRDQCVMDSVSLPFWNWRHLPRTCTSVNLSFSSYRVSGEQSGSSGAASLFPVWSKIAVWQVFLVELQRQSQVYHQKTDTQVRGFHLTASIVCRYTFLQPVIEYSDLGDSGQELYASEMHSCLITSARSFMFSNVFARKEGCSLEIIQKTFLTAFVEKLA